MCDTTLDKRHQIIGIAMLALLTMALMYEVMHQRGVIKQLKDTDANTAATQLYEPNSGDDLEWIRTELRGKTVRFWD